MLRNLIRLGIVLLIAHALYHFVPPYVHYHQFQDGVSEIALFAKDMTDGEILDRVMEAAGRYDIPIERDAVQITRDKQFTYIDVAYEEPIEWVPTFTRPMPFSVSAQGWNTLPPAR